MRQMLLLTVMVACAALVSCGADRRPPAADGGGVQGGGQGDGEGGQGGQGGAGEGEGEGEGQEDEGGGDEGELIGDIVLPDCTDLDQDGYGEGTGCRGTDIDDTDKDIFPGAREICDGKDNDGDSLVDNLDDDFSPDLCPLTLGVCQGSNAECRDGASQPCEDAVYGGHYVLEEDRFDGMCDGRDNDCDGHIDEECECTDGIVDICPDDACSDHSCAEGRWGSCLRKRNPEPEICDGIDNNCNGAIDEPDNEFSPPLCGRCPFDMMLVDLNNLDVCVDRWEASRPDSSSVTPGSIDDGMAISRPGVLPWVALDRASALTACRKAGRDRWPGDGKDLCTVNQWQQACIYTGRIELDPDWVYPYGRTYDPTRCNGLDADRNRSEATGSFEGCSVLDIIRGAMDMSGNVAEWVDERVEGQRAILGGSYLSEKDALKCEAPELVSSNAEELHIGFRCCKGLSNN